MRKWFKRRWLGIQIRWYKRKIAKKRKELAAKHSERWHELQDDIEHMLNNPLDYDNPLMCEKCGKATPKGKYVVDEGHQENYLCEECE